MSWLIFIRACHNAFNLSIIASCSELSDKEILKTVLGQPTWIEFLKTKPLPDDTQAQHLNFLKALNVLLIAGNSGPILSAAQSDMILHNEVLFYNNREIYQKIIDDPDSMSVLLQANPGEINNKPP